MTDNQIQAFKNNEFGEIRTIDDDGKIMFCGHDIADALGYTNTNATINRHCRESGIKIYEILDNKGRTQNVKFISEGNLYRLIVQSQLPAADQFESWVFDEVLPSIRKHGMYIRSDILNNEELLNTKIAELQADVKKITTKHRKALTQVRNLKKERKELQTRCADLSEAIKNQKLYSTTQVARQYGLSATELNQILEDLGVQYKRYGVWTLTHTYRGQDLTQIRKVDNGTVVYSYMVWTSKGVLFLKDLLSEENIHPIS